MATTIRRVMLSLAVFGFVALLASWSLWHITHPNVSACHGQHHQCDPATDMPYGYEAIALDLAGVSRSSWSRHGSSRSSSAASFVMMRAFGRHIGASGH